LFWSGSDSGDDSGHIVPFRLAPSRIDERCRSAKKKGSVRTTDIGRSLNPTENLPFYDPMDENGFVSIPQGPGLGFEFDWDYVNANLL
jgi:hypothetical protein